MFLLKTFYTNKLHTNLKLKVLKLKDTHWKYGVDSQVKYFSKSYKKNDLNNLLFFKNKLIGYTGLRKMNIIRNKKKIKFLLFDTLIVHELYRGIGLSKLLMEFNNAVIRKHKINSFLICKNKLSKFYKKFGWKIYKKRNILKCKNKNQVVMIFN